MALGANTYGPTPRQRIDLLQQLADRATNLTPEELLTTGAELTETFATERDPHIRRAIVQTLGVLPGDFADEALHQALHDPVAAVRCAACEAWASRTDASQALAVLHERITSDENPDVRLAAIEAISRFESPDAMQLLTSALDHRDPAIQMTAIASMRKVSGEDFGDDVVAWRQYAASQQARGGNPSASPAADAQPRQLANSAPRSPIQQASGYSGGSSSRNDGDFVQ